MKATEGVQRRQTIRGLRRGFTLVELLVVIGIIAVLMSILVPALNSARKKAQATECANDLKQLYMAVQMFAQDNRGHLPRPHTVPENSGNPLMEKVCVWLHVDGGSAAGYADLRDDKGALFKYMGVGEGGRQEALYCSGDTGEKVGTWTADARRPRNYSYSFNHQIASRQDPVRGMGGTKPYSLGIRLGTISGASEKVMIYEELAPNDTWNIIGLSSDDLPSARHGNEKALNAKRDVNSIGFKNNGRGNYCFFDGHITLLAPAEIDPSLITSNPTLRAQVTRMHRPLTQGDPG